MSKRILITGAAGFIGSHLCDRFVSEEFQVVGMDNLITGDLRNIEHLFPKKNFSFYHHDVSKFVHVPDQLDYILHFASPASPIDYLKMPIQTLKVGSLGTHNLLGLARVKKARILVASTSEVYGDPLVHPQNEEYWGHVNPVGPRGCYDEAKRFMEAAYKELKSVKKLKAGDKVPDVFGKISSTNKIKIVVGNAKMGGPIDYMYIGPMTVTGNYDKKKNLLPLNGELTEAETYAKTHNLYFRLRARREDQRFDPDAKDKDGTPKIYGVSPSRGDSAGRIVVTDKVPSTGVIVNI